MRLEEVAQALFIVAILLAGALWLSAERWDDLVAPAFSTIGAWAWIMRAPVFVGMALVVGFLLYRLSGPRS